MATIFEEDVDIKYVPQGYTLVAAFSTDRNWINLPGLMDKIFNINNRDNNEYGVGDVGKIDNLYMLFVKESSYDAPIWSALEKSLNTLAKKVVKKDIRNLAMPKLCCGKNGFDWEDVKGLIEEIFHDIDVNILVCSR